jgi:hypothetical protein
LIKCGCAALAATALSALRSAVLCLKEQDVDDDRDDY